MLLILSVGIYAIRYIHAKISLLRSLFKTLPVALMAGLSYWLGGPVLLTGALMFCAVGDYFLSLDDDRYFGAGLSAFMVGHLCYIAQFFELRELEPNDITLWYIGAVLVYALLISGFLWRKIGQFRTPVLLYIGVITVMALLSLSLYGKWLITLAAFMFVISNTILAVRMFVFGGVHPKAELMSALVWWSYILAQVLIFIGIMGAV
ncbi:MAG: lysoplasmalogenase [Paracoccaceae bacterium]